MKAKRKKTTVKKRKLVKLPRAYLLRRQRVSDGTWSAVADTNRRYLGCRLNALQRIYRNQHIIEIPGGTVEI